MHSRYHHGEEQTGCVTRVGKIKDAAEDGSKDSNAGGASTMMDTINHPNQFFELSVQAAGGINGESKSQSKTQSMDVDR